MTERFRVGVVSSLHGIRGEAKVYVTADSPKRFLELKTVRALPPEQGILLKKIHVSKNGILLALDSVRFFRDMAICKFKGIDTREAMRDYLGMELWIDRSEAVPLKEGEFYIADLIGLKAVTEEGEILGEILNVFPTGANHVITVRKKDGREILIPYIKECVKEILPEEGKMRIHLMEGLI